jgi:hypothetical protein
MCQNTSIAFMVTINVVFGLLGLFIIGCASYGLATLSEWEDFVDKTGLIIALVMGVFTFLLSFLGCFGALKGKKWMLGLYMLVEFIICAIMGAGAGVVLVYGGQLLSVDFNSGRSMSNVVLRSWEQCCQTQVDNLPTPSLCSYTDKRELWKCYFPKCDTNTEKHEKFCAYVEAPPTISKSVCLTIDAWIFDKDKNGNVAGTDNAWESKCLVDGSNAQWTGTVAKWMQSNIHTFGLGLTVMAVMLILLFTASAALCCTHQDKFDENDANWVTA